MHRLFATFRRFSTQNSTKSADFSQFVMEVGRNWQGYSVIGIAISGVTFVVSQLMILQGRMDKLEEIEKKDVELLKQAVENAQTVAVASAVKEAKDDFIKYTLSEDFAPLQKKLKKFGGSEQA